MKRILIVDDASLVRTFVRGILENQGYEVIEACDGREGLSRIEETKPDLVLMDIQMPVLNGFAALRQLRQDVRFNSLPVVAFTACAAAGTQEGVLAAGFDGCITKPVNARTLRAELEPFLRG